MMYFNYTVMPLSFRMEDIMHRSRKRKPVKVQKDNGANSKILRLRLIPYHFVDMEKESKVLNSYNLVRHTTMIL